MAGYKVVVKGEKNPKKISKRKKRKLEDEAFAERNKEYTRISKLKNNSGSGIQSNPDGTPMEKNASKAAQSKN